MFLTLILVLSHSFFTCPHGMQVQGADKVQDFFGGNKDSAEGGTEPMKEE